MINANNNPKEKRSVTLKTGIQSVKGAYEKRSDEDAASGTSERVFKEGQQIGTRWVCKYRPFPEREQSCGLQERLPLG